MGVGYGDGRLGAGEDPRTERRIGVVAAAIVLTFCVFLVRLFELQIIDGEMLRNRSEKNSVRTVRLEAPRGDIVDRNGKVLATTRPAYRVGVIPNEVRGGARTLTVLGQMLERDPAEMKSQISGARGRERFALAQFDGDVPYALRARVVSHRFALPGVVTDVLPRRHYLEQERAAHLLGTIGEIGSSQLESGEFEGYRQGDIVGQFGLESLLEPHLRGRAGGRNVVVDVAGREVERRDEVAPAPGGRVVLSLDLDLQRAAEDAFLAELPPEPKEGEEPIPPEPDKMGALVALDPRNGDILALVSRPAYNPNDFAGGIDAETWQALTTDQWEPLRNRALAGHYPPGSSYKAVVASAILSEKVVSPETTVFCPGYYRLGRRVYRCWKRGGHGDVNLRDALKHSCDVYFYTHGVELGIDKLAEYAKGFGLGQLTGIRLGGEKPGLVPSKEWKLRALEEEWIKGETVSAAIGQGFNLATPLQVAVAFAAIANGGTLYEPRLVTRLETWDGELVEERPVRERGRVPVSSEVLDIVREGLTAVVEDRGGTGGRARVRGLKVAGKTGTSQVVGMKVVEGLEDDEIPMRHRDHAWFAAFAPVQDPEIVVAVLVEHGGTGGRVAAPVAQRVLARYFEKNEERLIALYPPEPPAPPAPRVATAVYPDPAAEPNPEVEAFAAPAESGEPAEAVRKIPSFPTFPAFPGTENEQAPGPPSDPWPASLETEGGRAED